VSIVSGLNNIQDKRDLTCIHSSQQTRKKNDGSWRSPGRSTCIGTQRLRRENWGCLRTRQYNTLSLTSCAGNSFSRLGLVMARMWRAHYHHLRVLDPLHRHRLDLLNSKSSPMPSQTMGRILRVDSVQVGSGTKLEGRRLVLLELFRHDE